MKRNLILIGFMGLFALGMVPLAQAGIISVTPRSISSSGHFSDISNPSYNDCQSGDTLVEVQPGQQWLTGILDVVYTNDFSGSGPAIGWSTLSDDGSWSGYVQNYFPGDATTYTPFSCSALSTADTLRTNNTGSICEEELSGKGGGVGATEHGTVSYQMGPFNNATPGFYRFGIETGETGAQTTWYAFCAEVPPPPPQQGTLTVRSVDVNGSAVSASWSVTGSGFNQSGSGASQTYTVPANTPLTITAQSANGYTLISTSPSSISLSNGGSQTVIITWASGALSASWSSNGAANQTMNVTPGQSVNIPFIYTNSGQSGSVITGITCPYNIVSGAGITASNINGGNPINCQPASLTAP